MKRGMTLLELTLALSLLGALAIVCLSWVQFAGRSSLQVAEPLRWRLAADAFLASIEDDLLTGDFDSSLDEVRDPENRRVRSDGGALAIRTRARDGLRGPVLHRYELEDRERLVRSVEHVARSNRPRPEPRTLLTDVARFVVTIGEERDVLDVQLISRRGVRLSRRFAW